MASDKQLRAYAAASRDENAARRLRLPQEYAKAQFEAARQERRERAPQVAPRVTRGIRKARKPRPARRVGG